MKFTVHESSCLTFRKVGTNPSPTFTRNCFTRSFHLFVLLFVLLCPSVFYFLSLGFFPIPSRSYHYVLEVSLSTHGAVLLGQVTSRLTPGVLPSKKFHCFNDLKDHVVLRNPPLKPVNHFSNSSLIIIHVSFDSFVVFLFFSVNN